MEDITTKWWYREDITQESIEWHLLLEWFENYDPEEEKREKEKNKKSA